MIKKLFGLFLLFAAKVHALPIIGDQHFEAGPQFAHINLKCNLFPIKGNGILVGGYFKYDRLNGNSLYWGAEGSITEGDIYYESPKIRSTLLQHEIQGKLGLTLNVPFCYELFSVSPFVGVGDFRQKESNSPIVPDSWNHYTFLSAGFQSRLHLNDYLCFGLNLQTHSPLFLLPEVTQLLVEVPILVGNYPLCLATVGFNVTPYYQFRKDVFRFSDDFTFDSSNSDYFGVRLGIFLYF